MPETFSDSEIQFIKENYPEKGLQYVAMVLNRPTYSIRNKASKLKIKRIKPGKWSEEELMLLKKHYPNRGGRYVADKLNRQFNSVSRKAQRLGLKNKSFKIWDDFSKKYLLRNYGKKPVDSIARTLSRTVYAVRLKAEKMRLGQSARLRWSDSDKNKLRELYPNKDYSVKNISELLCRHYRTVYAIARLLGLKRPNIKQSWTQKEIKYLYNNYTSMTYKQIGKKLGLSESAVCVYARHRGLKKYEKHGKTTQVDEIGREISKR